MPIYYYIFYCIAQFHIVKISDSQPREGKMIRNSRFLRKSSAYLNKINKKKKIKYIVYTSKFQVIC